MEHTPSPWYTAPLSDGLPYAVLSSARYGDNDPEQICIIGTDIMSPLSDDENRANAVLMAHAPEMLSVLEETCKDLDDYITRHVATTELERITAQLERVIASARGTTVLEQCE